MTLKERLREEALHKLAWPSLMDYLSKESLCPQNAFKLKLTNPWICKQERKKNLSGISEILSLKRENLFIKLSPYDDTELKNLIRRRQLLSIQDLKQIYIALENTIDIHKIFQKNTNKFLSLAPELSKEIQSFKNTDALHQSLKLSIDRDTNDIKESASIKLKTLKKQLFYAEGVLQSFKKEYIQRTDVR